MALPVDYEDSPLRRPLWIWQSFGPRRERLQDSVQPTIIYGVDDRPPWGLCLLAGIQWIGLICIYLVYLLAIATQADLPTQTVSGMISAAMLALGFAALLQALPRGPVGTGYFCPAVPSANYLGPSLVALKIGGLATMFGMTLFAGCCQFVLGPIVAKRRHLIPAEISGLVVLLIGVTVGLIGIKFTFLDQGRAAHPISLLISFTTLGVAISLTVNGRSYWRMLSPLVGVSVGLVLAAAVRKWQPGGGVVSELSLPLFSVPSFGQNGWAFAPELVFPFFISAVASSAKTIGVLSMCQRLNDVRAEGLSEGAIRRGVWADGLGTAIAGLCGTLGVNSMPSSAAIPAATGLASRRLSYVIAAMFMLLAFVPAVGLFIATIPRSIVGALAIYTGCFVAVSGLQAITSVSLDQRKTIIVGLGLFAGVAVEVMPQLSSGMNPWLAPITGSSLVLGTLVAILANAALPNAALTKS